MKIAIIGGTGKMGRWFARLLKDEGKEVLLVGRNQEKLAAVGNELGLPYTTDIAEAGKTDAVIISVAIDSFEEVAAQLGKHTRPEQIILDLTSIKETPVAAMKKHIKQGAILGAHPVFGPGARSLSGQNVALTPTSPQEKELAERVRTFLEKRGAKVVEMTPRQHDEAMSVVLGLAHFIAITSADSLLKLDGLEQMEAVGGTTYKVLLTLVESVLSEDPELYASLQMSLPGLAEKETSFLESGRQWAETVKSGSHQQFTTRMKALKERLEEGNADFGKAYRNMYRIAEKD